MSLEAMFGTAAQVDLEAALDCFDELEPHVSYPEERGDQVICDWAPPGQQPPGNTGDVDKVTRATMVFSRRTHAGGRADEYARWKAGKAPEPDWHVLLGGAHGRP